MAKDKNPATTPAPDKSERIDAALSGDDKTQRTGSDSLPEVTENNPHGLDIHERFNRLLAFLRTRGFHHSETAHPMQNAATTADKFARLPADGINAQTPEGK